MSPFHFGHKDRLAPAPMADPVAAEALVVRGDPGYSAMTWWSARILLRVAIAGSEPGFVTHECNVVREKSPLAGMVLPVDVERTDPKVVRIRWEEVPSIEQRISSRDPLILDPESVWQTVLEADPRQADQKPSWGDECVAGWPSINEVRPGRQAGTALVVAHSGDPEGCFFAGNFVAPNRATYSSGGMVETLPHKFPGWLLLCVIPQDGERYGLQLQTMVMREHLAPVLPVAIDPSKPDDIEILWDSAPEVVTTRTARQAADAELIERASQDRAGSSAEALAAIDNPIARKLAQRLAKKGVVLAVSHNDAEDPPDLAGTSPDQASS
jgi:hypothetical protein